MRRKPIGRRIRGGARSDGTVLKGEAVDRGEEQALRSYRDDFRRNIDYSALFFLALWGLNVVDATVDAHLKPFDVSPDLSLRFKIGPSDMARTTGVSLVLAFK